MPWGCSTSWGCSTPSEDAPHNWGCSAHPEDAPHLLGGTHQLQTTDLDLSCRSQWAYWPQTTGNIWPTDLSLSIICSEQSQDSKTITLSAVHIPLCLSCFSLSAFLTMSGVLEAGTDFASFNSRSLICVHNNVMKELKTTAETQDAGRASTTHPHHNI